MKIDFSQPQDFKNLHPQTDFEKKVIDFVAEFLSKFKTIKVQTSGSTGLPKILEVEKSKMLHSAKMTCDFLGLKMGDSALLCLPIDYISGKMMVVRSIVRQLNLQMVEPSIFPLKELNEPIHFCAMTPLQVENSLDKLHLINKLIIGGASVSEKLKNKIIHNKLSPEDNFIYETYGMSETLSHIALKQIFPNSEDYFTPLKGIEIALDSRGCLVIDAPNIAENKIVTNDLVEINDQKQFRFIGRIDNVINSGGAKIFPEELESLVKKRISNEVVFIGKPDEKLGQKLILIVEDKLQEMKIEDVEKELAQIPFAQKFHFPKEIILVNEIPRTPNGKIDRRTLLKQIQK